MFRLLVGFSYDGSLFTGFQRGNGNRSIEDEIQNCMDKFSLGINLRCASRTDRNVSALCNFLTLDTGQDPKKIMGILNSEIRGMTFHSYAHVGDHFNVRHATMKEYAYIIPSRSIDHEILSERLHKFEGTHDFKNFCRPEGKNTVREIKKIWLSEMSGLPAVFFRARGFLWNQIRFIMGYGLMPENRSEDPFSEDWPRKLAPPYNLILVKIEYEGIKTETYINRSIFKYMESERDKKRSSYAYYNALSEYLI